MPSWTLKNYFLILIFLVSLAYLPFVKNQFVWDDEQFIYNNQYVKTFAVKQIFTENTLAGAGETSNYYRPLTTLSFAFDHQFWGLNPIGFHLTNTLIHLSAGLVLFVLLRRLGLSKLTSFIVSAVFLIHPLRSQSVVYVNARGDSFYTLLALLSLLCFWLLIKRTFPQHNIYNLTLKLSAPILAIGSIVFFVLSLLAKEIALGTLILYFLFLIHSALLSLKKQKLKKIIIEHKTAIFTFLALVIAGAGYLTLRFTVLKFHEDLNLYDPSSPYGSSVLVRLFTFSKILWIYGSLILFPYPLHMERDTTVVTNFLSLWPILTILLLVALAFLGWLEHQRRGTHWIWLGSGWFIGMLIPVSGIFPINGMLYEHWLYMPIIGFLLAGYGLLKLLPSKIKNVWITWTITIILSLYLLLTWRQNYIWATPVRFYTYTLQFSQTPRLHNNLAMAYAENKQHEQAITHYEQAITLGDFYPQTHYNLGNTYLDMGEVEKAQTEYETALKMGPNFQPARVGLLNIYLSQSEYAKALQLTEELLVSNADNPQLLVLKSELEEKLKVAAP